MQRAAPSVVNVYAARLVTERVAPSLGELFGDYMPRYRQRIERSLGSGVIVDESGHIVTNHHVIANADSIRVQLADGRVADAKIVGRDPDTDLAVLKIDLTPLPVAVFGRSDQLKVGDVVLAIGNPVGLSQTVTHGIVSATSRQQLGIAPLEDFIQTDAADQLRQLRRRARGRQRRAGRHQHRHRRQEHRRRGHRLCDSGQHGARGPKRDHRARPRHPRLDRHRARGPLRRSGAQLGLPQSGVVIGNLYVGSPAQQAGLQPGDLLTAIDGTAPHSAQDALGRIASHKPGTHRDLRGLRGGRAFEVRAQVGERPHPP